MIHQTISKPIRLLGLVTFGIWLAALQMPGWAQAASFSLPPRPSTPTAAPAPGGTIQLQARQPQPGAWTVVEWQDALGSWHAVTGWQGSFDWISSGIGFKTWWVALEDLGKGPFRWRVYWSGSGKILATSAPFNLPAASRVMVTVEVTPVP